MVKDMKCVFLIILCCNVFLGKDVLTDLHNGKYLVMKLGKLDNEIGKTPPAGHDYTVALDGYDCPRGKIWSKWRKKCVGDFLA